MAERITQVDVSMLIRKVGRTIRRYGMIHPGERVLVALSGGPDSVAMTHILCELGRRREAPFHIVLAHLNHQLRPESDEDEAFCAQLAEQLGLEWVSERADVADEAHRRRRSLEEAGRLERCRFLKYAARERRCTRIALGHTQNDQAETLLLRILRGAGTRGLSAIYPVVEDLFVRPLLDVKRDEVIDFLTHRGHAFRLDRSNEDRSIPRNRIRHEALPSLAEAFNPALVETLARTADLLRDEEAWLEQEASRTLEDMAWSRSRGEELRLPVEGLASLHPALARRVVRAGVRLIKGDLRGWSAQHVEAVLQLTSPGKSGRSLALPGIASGRSFGELWLRRPPRRGGKGRDGRASGRVSSRVEGGYQAQDGYNEYEYELPVPGCLEIPEAGGMIQAEESRQTFLPAATGTTVVVGLSKMEESGLKVRSPRPGDRFRPLGAPGTKSMCRYLMEQRVAVDRRRQVPLVVYGNDVLWVVGHGISELSRVGPGAHRMLRLSWVEA